MSTLVALPDLDPVRRRRRCCWRTGDEPGGHRRLGTSGVRQVPKSWPSGGFLAMSFAGVFCMFLFVCWLVGWFGLVWFGLFVCLVGWFVCLLL